MLELKRNGLAFSFPEVHRGALLRVEFQRTLRIPDDGRVYPRPPGLGLFPLRRVDASAARLPDRWLAHGGVMLPMYQGEAVGVYFAARSGYPFAVKIATGKVDAVTGEAWTDGLHRDPQDYVVVPEQPWLDGYCVEQGIVRQFVVMPLRAGYTAEEQLTGEAEYGGLQVVAYPMKREAYERIVRERSPRRAARLAETGLKVQAATRLDIDSAPGGRMRQQIHADPHAFDVWDLRQRGSCFVHLANALVWRSLTGEDPPTTPPTAEEYTVAELPWFEYYGADVKALEGAKQLADPKNGVPKEEQMGDAPPLPERAGEF